MGRGEWLGGSTRTNCFAHKRAKLGLQSRRMTDAVFTDLHGLSHGDCCRASAHDGFVRKCGHLVRWVWTTTTQGGCGKQLYLSSTFSS